MYCADCNKEVETETKISNWFYSESLTYEREVCSKCGNVYLLDKDPGPEPDVKPPVKRYRIDSSLNYTPGVEHKSL